MLKGEFPLPHALLGHDPATPGHGGVRRYDASTADRLQRAAAAWLASISFPFAA